MLYFDNAATTPMSDAAIKALYDVSLNQFGNPSSNYGIGRKAKEILEESRRIIANCIGAENDEIVFTSGGTEGNNWVIKKGSSTSSRIITTEIEHHAILNPAEELRKLGISVDYLPVDEKCSVTPSILASSLDGSEVLVSIMLQNNETGSIQRVRELSEIVHRNNRKSLFHTDAVQAVGHIPIDVKELDVDFLSASAHKFNGPKGVGFLYLKRELNPFILGGGQEKGLRSGTENIAGIYSMAKALEDNVCNMHNNKEHIGALEQMFFELLRKTSIDFKVNADSDSRAIGIVNLAIKGVDGEGLQNALDLNDICISIGSACNSKTKQQSHVLTAMGLDSETIDSSVRISLGRYNTKEDIQTLVTYIKKYCDLVKCYS